MPPSELWLVRHGESVANRAASRAELDGLERIPIDVRDADVVLSETGREQALALGRLLAAEPAFDAYWVSPYVRARETLLLALGPDATARIVVDERLRDRELGILDLLTSNGVARRHPEEAERRRRLGKYYHRPPGGESWADVGLRLRSLLRDLPGDGRVIVVAHDAVVMLLLSLLLPIDEAELLRFAAENTVLNASVTRLRRGPGGWELVVFSDVAHLLAEDAPVTVHAGDDDVEPR